MLALCIHRRPCKAKHTQISCNQVVPEDTAALFEDIGRIGRLHLDKSQLEASHVSPLNISPPRRLEELVFELTKA